MPVITAQRRVKAHTDLVWRCVADLGGDHGVPPEASRVEVLDGEGASLRRRVISREGRGWLEEVVDWQPEQRFTVKVEAERFPVACARLRYSCSITEEENRILLRLWFDYQPRYGALSRIFGLRTRRDLESYARAQLDNWVRVIHAREWAYRVTAKTLLDEKGNQVLSVQPDTTVAAAAALLSEHRIGAVPALDSDGNIAGMISERDIVRGLSEHGEQLLTQPVANIMTKKVVVADPADNMMLIMACMSGRRIRHLPVVEAGKLLGLISIGDVIKARTNELEGQSETLRGYIDARRWHELYQELGPAAYAEEQTLSPPIAE
jgi:CBS domain-containing protein